jgi:hypothetical protein
MFRTEKRSPVIHRAPVTLVAHDIGPAAQLVFGHHLAKHHGDHCGIQWRPLVTSTFLGQHNSYAGKAIRPLHIMVTSTMSNRLGEGCILMVLKQENLKTCCKSYVFTLVDVQGEGVRLDFVATDLQNVTPRSSGICRDAVACTWIYYDLMGSSGQRWEGSGTTLERTPKRPLQRPSNRR